MLLIRFKADPSKQIQLHSGGGHRTQEQTRTMFGIVLLTNGD